MLDMSANACIRVYLCERCMCVIHVLAIAPCANGKSEAGKRERQSAINAMFVFVTKIFLSLQLKA